MDTTDTDDRLVCGLDDSDHAPGVLAVAAELAQRLSLKLRLVHSPDPDLFLVGERRREALRRGAELLDSLVPADLVHDRVVQLGGPANLLRAELEDGAALAVVGSRGRGAVRAAAFGSTSQALTASAPCPVVVVPPHATELAHGPFAVVCGVDGSAGADAALASADALARRLGSELVAVHVQAAAVPVAGATLGPVPWRILASPEARRAALAVVERAVDRMDPEAAVRMRVESGDPAERLAAVAAEQPSAMLVVGSRGHGPLHAALVGSVSSRLCAAAPVPVLVVPRASRSMRRSDQRERAAMS